MNIPGLFEPSAGEAACLALIRRNESGGQYNILCGGGHFLDYSAFPQWKGFRGSHAAGAYQFEPATWAWVASKCALPDFSPIAQDIAALWLLRLVGPNSSESWQASGPYPTPAEIEAQAAQASAARAVAERLVPRANAAAA